MIASIAWNSICFKLHFQSSLLHVFLSTCGNVVEAERNVAIGTALHIPIGTAKNRFKKHEFLGGKSAQSGRKSSLFLCVRRCWEFWCVICFFFKTKGFFTCKKWLETLSLYGWNLSGRMLSWLNGVPVLLELWSSTCQVTCAGDECETMSNNVQWPQYRKSMCFFWKEKALKKHWIHETGIFTNIWLIIMVNWNIYQHLP